MPEQITVVNTARRPVDLDTGAVLAPGERATVAAAATTLRKVELGLLRQVENKPADEQPAHRESRSRARSEKETAE